MSERTDSALQLFDNAERLIPVGSVWMHKKGGTYVVVGYTLDVDTGTVRIRCKRVAGPGFNARKESPIEYARRIEEWTNDRFQPLPDGWLGNDNWRCKRCGNLKSQGCGMPDYLVAVPYSTGVEYEHPACPLVYIGKRNIFRRALDSIFG